jgi:hypothetical protein
MDKTNVQAGKLRGKKLIIVGMLVLIATAAQAQYLGTGSNPNSHPVQGYLLMPAEGLAEKHRASAMVITDKSRNRLKFQSFKTAVALVTSMSQIAVRSMMVTNSFLSNARFRHGGSSGT